MILGIDIGNTSISFGIIKGKRVLKHRSVITVDAKLVRSKVATVVRSMKRTHNIEDVVICSVVPKDLKVVEGAVKSVFKKKAKVIGRDLKVPIKNNYRKPKQVGEDRLVGAYAAKMLYGTPTIIIDLGTAITFDVVTKKGEYDGGIIIPGIQLSAESLFKKTALLPKLDKIKSPKTLVGKDTKESILSGLFYGYGALCSGLIDEISSKVKPKPKVIVTGGHTELMKRFIAKKITARDENLVFKGIDLTYKAAKPSAN